MHRSKVSRLTISQHRYCVTKRRCEAQGCTQRRSHEGIHVIDQFYVVDLIRFTNLNSNKIADYILTILSLAICVHRTIPASDIHMRVCTNARLAGGAGGFRFRVYYERNVLTTVNNPCSQTAIVSGVCKCHIVIHD